ncbi:MAG: IS200/IS605 family transposase [Prolixibacteraceae bacterium]|nr:IS200/IS605 family transposase [Prolixibacteraceae bacterium]
MSYVKIWIHTVWTVKNREPLLNQDIRKEVLEHIHQNALEKEILMEIVNGYHNHVHCLFRLRNNQTIENVMQLIKGESSFWFNRSDLSRLKLSWQKEYFAVSVSESQVEKVINYIANQEEHHKTKTWEDEYNEFITKYNFQIING